MSDPSKSEVEAMVVKVRSLPLSRMRCVEDRGALIRPRAAAALQPSSSSQAFLVVDDRERQSFYTSVLTAFHTQVGCMCSCCAFVRHCICSPLRAPSSPPAAAAPPCLLLLAEEPPPWPARVPPRRRPTEVAGRRLNESNSRCSGCGITSDTYNGSPSSRR